MCLLSCPFFGWLLPGTHGAARRYTPAAARRCAIEARKRAIVGYFFIGTPLSRRGLYF